MFRALGFGGFSCFSDHIASGGHQAIALSCECAAHSEERTGTSPCNKGLRLGVEPGTLSRIPLEPEATKLL